MVQSNNYRESIKKLNYTYLTMLKEIAQNSDGLATNVLELDRPLLTQMATTEVPVLERLASEGMPLFRVRQLEHRSRSILLVEMRQEQQAKALITMRAIAGAGGGEQNGG
jgi:hypothetical protein